MHACILVAVSYMTQIWKCSNKNGEIANLRGEEISLKSIMLGTKMKDLNFQILSIIFFSKYEIGVARKPKWEN